MDSSESPTHGEQEGSAWNGHFGCTCYHPLFVFNQFGDLERCLLRPGNVHSAEDWRLVLEPVIARYRERGVDLYFRADAAFAKPEIYELLEAEGIRYAIRLPANQVLQRRIGHLLKRPVGRPPKKPIVSYASFRYQAKGWTQARRVVAKVEWHQGELYPRVGFIVTNLTRPNKRVVKFYNGRGTAEQWIKEGKNAIRWTRLSCHAFRHNAVRLQLHALAYNLANFLRTLGPARGGRALVADDAAREAGQDRRPDRAPRPLRGVPAGRGGGAASAVRRDPAPDRWPAATAAAAPGMRIGSDERRRPSKRGASMIDREPLPRSDNSGAQASECRCGPPRGAARAAGGLLHPANRRMIVVQEPANGESRLRSLCGSSNTKAPDRPPRTCRRNGFPRPPTWLPHQADVPDHRDLSAVLVRAAQVPVEAGLWPLPCSPRIWLRALPSGTRATARQRNACGHSTPQLKLSPESRY